MQTKLSILNKNKNNNSFSETKKIYLNNSSKNKSNIIYNQDETLYSKNIKNENNSIANSKNESNYNMISYNIKQKTLRNNQNNLSMNNINDNLSLYYKYLNYDKYNKVRKSLDKNNSAPNIYLHERNNSSNANRKKFISNYLKKINNNVNNPQNGNLSNNLPKNNDMNYNTKDNNLNYIYNLKNNVDNNLGSKSNLKKFHMNIHNKTFILNKNKSNINLSTSILGENINIEKYIAKQKLSEYRKLIEQKVDKLIKDKITKNNQNDKENKRLYSPKSKAYKKINKIMSSSDFGRNKKTDKNSLFSNTNYKNSSNEDIKNLPDKITIIPKRIQDYEPKINYNSILVKDNINKNKFKKISKNANIKGKIYLDSYNEMMNKKNIF